jgi:hypothetical protein
VEEEEEGGLPVATAAATAVAWQRGKEGDRERALHSTFRFLEVNSYYFMVPQPLLKPGMRDSAFRKAYRVSFERFSTCSEQWTGYIWACYWRHR